MVRLKRADARARAREILGLDETATADDAKKAFRKKALTAHPDKGGDEASFIKLQQALEVLWALRFNPKYLYFHFESAEVQNANI